MGARVFLLQIFRLGPWAHPVSYSICTGVKHSCRGLPLVSTLCRSYELVEPCLYFPRMLSGRVQGLFPHLSHGRYMSRPSSNEVAMQCEAPIIQISACCYLSGPHIQPPHHSALQPPLLARPTMLHLFIVITMEKDTSQFHTWQV